MEICRLCFGLLQENSFLKLGDSYKCIINNVMPEVDLEITSSPVICNQCSGCVDEVHKFKLLCFESQQKIKENSKEYRHSHLTLKEILGSSDSNAMVPTNVTKKRICCTCLQSVESESFTILKPTNADAYLESMLSMCLPEVDLQITSDPIMCENCLKCLQKFHQLKTVCLDVEEKLGKYKNQQGTSIESPVNLHKVYEVLQEPKSVKAEFDNTVDIKSEITDEACEKSNKDVENEYVPQGFLPGLLKQEDVEIKSEEFKSWDIVFWDAENSCDFVPSIWAANSSKTTYLFPTNATRNTITRLIRNCEIPSNSKYKFKEHGASYKKTVHNFEDAERLVEKAMETDNFDQNGHADIVFVSVDSQSDIYSSSSAVTPAYTPKSDTNLNKKSPNHITIIMNDLKSLKYEIKELKESISRIANKLDKYLSQNPETSMEQNSFTLPINSYEELEQIVATLTAEADKRNQLVRLLSLVGGGSVRQNVNRVLQKLLSKSVALQFSLRGKQSKKPFHKLPLYSIVIDAVRQTYTNATEQEIGKYIGFALASAGDRDGGRKCRSEKRRSEGVESDIRNNAEPSKKRRDDELFFDF